MYFKLYPLQEVMGLLFGFHQSEVNRWVHRLTPVLEKTLDGGWSCRRADRRI